MRKIDRFDKYMEVNGLNDSKVTNDLGISMGTIGKSRKQNRDLSDNTIEKILNYYRDLNRVWLLTGEGEMLNSELSNMETPLPSDTITMSREIFDEIMKLIDIISYQQETINSQSKTIKMLAQWGPCGRDRCCCEDGGGGIKSRGGGDCGYTVLPLHK